MIVPIWKPVIVNHSILSESPISSTEVHLWRANLSQPAEILNYLWQSLTPDEQERTQRFRFESHRNWAIASRGILRSILADYLSEDPKGLKFGYTEKGKPFVVKCRNPLRLEFNLSHSNDLALYAIALHHPVGVDIEADREIDQLAPILQRYFSPQERANITAYPNEQTQRFFQYWTAKEAVAKATGQGISEVTSIEFWEPLPEGQCLLTRTANPDTQWQVWLLKPQVNYFGSIACSPQVRSLTFFERCFT